MRVVVTKVWDSWADRLATDLTYGVLGVRYKSWLRDVSVRSTERRHAACFAQSRSLWNRYVSKSCKDKHFTELETAARLSCRPSGVQISGAPRKYSCHDPFCPSCQHRSIARLLRVHRSWAKTKKLDVVTWQIQIPENDVLTPAGIFRWRSSCDYARKTLIKLARTDKSRGLVVARLWVERPRIDEPATYYHQLAITGTELNQEVYELAQSDSHLERPAHVYAEYGTSAKNALSVLRYCSGWLRVSRDIGARVILWNRQFRKRPL